tara:strand:+ start:237 stop:485 length:249 start_codon:yes stop_codon:yes gene_type:complete
MKNEKTFRFILREPLSGDRVVVDSDTQTFPEAVSAAYIKQKELMHTTSKDYHIIGAVELDAAMALFEEFEGLTSWGSISSLL